MIIISIPLLIVFFVSIPLLIISGLALYYNIRTIHKPNREKENIYICNNCKHIYALNKNRPMDRCPRCGNLNDAVRA